MWKESFFQFIKENPHFIQPMVHLVPEIIQHGIDLADPPSHPPSSHGSVLDCGKYPVDDITENTPCTLHMTLGKRGKTLMKVEEGIAMPGHTFHTVPIPQECARVQIIKVIVDKYLTCEIDYPNEEEGIETLEDAINQFVLWPRPEIIIHTVLDSP